MKAKSFILIPIIASLVACGGGGSDTNNLNTSGLNGKGLVSVIITDNLTLTYSEVWVSVESINTIDANGAAVNLYQDTTGQVHNLSQLVNVGALVDAQTVTPGTYTSFDITLANNIKLVDLNGVVIDATFDQTGNPSFTTTVTGNLTVDANQVATLLLDFDLQQFTYDVATNTVNPVVVQKDPAAVNQTVATTTGQVQTVNNANQFVLTPNNGGTNMTVNLHNNATVTNPTTGAITATTTTLQPGATVTVTGTYDATNVTVTASDVQIDTGTFIARHEVEGFVTSFDGSNLTLDVKEATFAPSTNEISISNASNAIFRSGSLAMITVGQELEVKGQWDGNTFTATVIKIDGAPRNAVEDSHNYLDDYAEIEGRIDAINNELITLTVQKREHVSGVALGAQVTIDSSNSWLKKGDSSCLVTGALIEAKGSMTDTLVMDAKVIEIESGCAQFNGDDDSAEDSNDDNDNQDDDNNEQEDD